MIKIGIFKESTTGWKRYKTILSDCDGPPSNSSPYYIFTQDLQALVNELAIEIPIPNYPPYTSKYNPHISPYFSPVSGADF
jgi:hypothetical protein